MLSNGCKALDADEVEVTTFAQAGRGPEDISFDGNNIQANGLKLRETLDRLGTAHQLPLNSFDFLVLVSRTATLFDVLEVLKGYRVSDWKSTRRSGFVHEILDPDYQLGDPYLITEAALHACLLSRIRTNQTYSLCAQIRQVSAVPIFVVPAPLLAEQTPQLRPKLLGLKRALRGDDGQNIRLCLERAHDAAFQDIPDVVAIPQPAETIAHGCLTKTEFGRDSVRLASPHHHDETDILHAGAKMGALIMAEILQRVQHCRTLSLSL